MALATFSHIVRPFLSLPVHWYKRKSLSSTPGRTCSTIKPPNFFPLSSALFSLSVSIWAFSILNINSGRVGMEIHILLLKKREKFNIYVLLWPDWQRLVFVDWCRDILAQHGQHPFNCLAWILQHCKKSRTSLLYIFGHAFNSIFYTRIQK